MNILNVEKCVNEGVCGDGGDKIKKLSRTLQERFISFWRKSIWSNKPARGPNHSNKLRTYRYFKRSFTNETCLKTTGKPSANLEPVATHLCVRLVDTINYHMGNESASFVLPKKLNLSSISCLNANFIMI